MKYAIGVGSNRGDRAAIIAAAESALGPELRLVARATLVETAPEGGAPGDGPYLNGAWLIETALGPHQVLHRLQEIETASGRTRSVRWAARTLDLDLLLDEAGTRIHDPVLELPHPRLAQRRFVLDPLATLVPGWREPLSGLTILALRDRLPPAAH